MNRPTLKKAKKRKPAGYDKDIRTAMILNMIGGAIGVNIAPNYLANCHPRTQRAVVRRLRRFSNRSP